ncbi:MAG: hypothetical protein MN733_20090, partial [Nitrososphaera sp.]|nr:hypothetical protein [Nitrososphaera sp.]
MGCSSEHSRAVGSNYEVVSVGGSSILHNPQNLQLCYKPHSGSRVKIWPFLVTTFAPRNPLVYDDLAVFNAGTWVDKETRTNAALMVYTYPGNPAEVTELVTKKYCEDAGHDYERL